MMNSSWHPLIAESAFPSEGKLATIIGGWHILAARTEDGFFAINDRCTHQAAHLSGGRVRRGTIMCPLHGARFELATGRCIGSAYADARSFAVRIVDGMIEVSVPGTPPGMDETPVEI